MLPPTSGTLELKPANCRSTSVNETSNARKAQLVSELSHVNVATSFRKMLQVSRGGVLEGTVQNVLDALEKSVKTLRHSS